MGGAVQTVKNTVSDIGTSIKEGKPLKALGQAGAAYAGAITGGVLGGAAAQKTTKSISEGASIVSGVKSGTMQTAQTAGIIDSPEPLPSVVIEDPAQVAERDKMEKARARRQAQIDLQKGQPGRGGTILTDQYRYNL